MRDPETWHLDPTHRRLVPHTAPGSVPLPVLDGLVTTADPALAWATDDFGRTTSHRPPLGVVRPASTEDIGAVLRFAGEHDIPVVPRAEGHCTGGQAQAPGGLVLDMRGLHTVHHVGADQAIVDAGARWSDVLAATLPVQAAPPVLTDYLDLSVGGTLSVGGISGATHHFGLQTDNVVELDVVTTDGTLVTCSPHANAPLFDAVRAGGGRHGVITRATLRLVPAHTHARWYRLRYDDLATFLADQRTLMTEGRFQHLQGQAKPVDDTWTYRIDGVSYFTPPTTPAEQHLLAGLADRRDALEVTDLTYHGFQNRLAEDVALLRTLGPWQHPHPWLNLLLPDHATEQIVADTLATLIPQDIGDSGVVLLYPVPRARITTPRFRLPDTPIAFLFALLRAAPPDNPAVLRKMLDDNRALEAEVMAAGGAVYLGGVDT